MKKSVKILLVIFVYLLSFCGGLNKNKCEIVYADSISQLDQDELENKIPDIYEEVESGVLTVVSYEQEKGVLYISSFGSGFIYDEDNLYYYFITNNHVVEDAVEVMVELYNHQSIQATILGVDGYQDVAVGRFSKVAVKTQVKVLKTKDNQGNYFSYGRGDTVFSVGTPNSFVFKNTLNVGVISRVDSIVTQDEDNIFFQAHCIQMDVAINPGNSGGPLIDMEGHVIGVNSIKLTYGTDFEISGLSFAFTAEDMCRMADYLRTKYSRLTGAYVNEYRICISENVNYLSLKDINLNSRNEHGLLSQYKGVVLLNKDSSLNLNKYSLITKINDIEVDDVVIFRRVLSKFNEGEEVNLTVYKNVNNKLESEPTIIKVQLVKIDIVK